MKVTIKQVNAYEITIDGVTHTGFTKNDNWRGMVSFSSPKGEVIVADERTPFEDMFGTKKEKKHEFDIVQISSGLIPNQNNRHLKR